MDPHLGIVLNRGVRHQSDWIPVMKMLNMPVTSGEDRAMDRRPEQLGTAVGKRRGEAGQRKAILDWVSVMTPVKLLLS